MELNGKLVSTTSIKSDGDVFYKLIKEPHLISNICPDTIQSVDLLSGHWGAVGSVVVWTCVLDGEKMVAKEMIESIDENMKSITYKVLDGDLLKMYKTFKFIINVDKNGEDNLVTWTLEYEKMTEDVPDPCRLMDASVDGEKNVSKEFIQSKEEKKKSLTYKEFEGDLTKVYKTFKFIINVDKNGEDNLVTWTLEYEKKNEDVPNPCYSWMFVLVS
ncbi:hypothetical protein BUALT_Bualt05G0110400 [Buddleja alternifolia]|uniref:Bet v I/Major latex protein domain-containing protein n=1 Tax=Buddleja alternifolia TaxID=168488 RepID=A0AAV6XQ96_9LAMI|nr:hypothetical protein BUALT_Bualt05G0110400 [Buddleja alternifolia]